jgi:hypothetical protein
MVLKGRVQARLKQIRQAKEPFTSVDLNVWQGFVPSGENGAIEVLQASNYIVTNAPNMNHGFWGQDHLTPEQLAALSRIVSLNSNVFSHLEPALKRPRARYPVDWSPGPGTLLPHLAKVTSLANLLEARARLAAFQSNAAVTISSIQQIIALSRTLESEPCLVSQMVRLSAVSRAVSDLELLLNHFTLHVSQIQPLCSAFEGVDKSQLNSLHRSLLGERAIGVYIFQSKPPELASILDMGSGSRVVSPTFDPLVLFNPIVIYQASPAFDADFLYFLGITSSAIHAAQLPFPQSLDATAKIQADVTTTRSNLHLISNRCLPDYQNIITRYAYQIARCRLAVAALEIEELRANHNLPPPNSDLKLPLDPFSGRPLAYQPLDTGCLIYSWGPDRKDDHGIPMQTSHSRQDVNTRQDAFASAPGDIIFTLSR